MTGGNGSASGAVVRPVPDDRRPSSRSAPGSSSTPPASGPTRSAPSTRARTPTPSARPRACTSRCRPIACPCDIAAVIPVPKDRRSIFVVSWPGTDLVYLGTTDTDYAGPLDDPACTPEDVDYLLDAANNVTTSQLTRADVTGVWAGLRPLLAPAGQGRTRLGAHGRPVAPPHRHARRPTAS